MKKTLLLMAFITLFYNCNKDRCSEGYKPHDSNGHEICIPEFLTGQDHDFKIGSIYIHEVYGVITLKNGIWRNELNEIISIK